MHNNRNLRLKHDKARMKRILFVLISFFTLMTNYVTAQSWSHTFTSEDAVALKNKGSVTLGDVIWNIDWKEMTHSFEWWDKYSIIHFGSGNYPTNTTISTSAFNGQISEISIESSTNSSAKKKSISVFVNNKAYTCNGETSATLTSSIKTYSFTGTEEGEICIKLEGIVNLKSIKITYGNQPTLKDPQLSFPKSSYTLEIGSDEYKNFAAPVLNNAYNVDVDYLSDNEDIASVDAQTGVVTLGSTSGTANIYAVSQATETFSASTASYSITLQPAVIEQYNWVRVNLNDINYSDDIIIVDANSQYALPNTNDKEGSPTGISIKLSADKTLAYLDNNISEETLIWNVKSTAYGSIFYPSGQTKNYLCFGGEAQSVHVVSNGTNYVFNEETYEDKNGVMHTTLYSNNRFLCLYNSTYTGLADWRCYLIDDITKISTTSIAYYRKMNAYETVTLKRDGFTTYVTENAIDWSRTLATNGNINGNIADVHGFKVIEFDKSTVVLQEFGIGDAETITPAETPVVVKGLTGDNYLLIATEVAENEVEGNLLCPSDGNITAPSDRNFYIMQTINGVQGWHKLGSQTIPAQKAYLDGKDEAEKVSHLKSNPAKGIYVSTDETTGIKDITCEETKTVNLVFYSLKGTKISNPTRGLYILNGKKIVIK